MKLINETNYDTKELRKLIWNEVKDFSFSDIIKVFVTYRRSNSRVTGRASYSGSSMQLFLERENHKIADLISTVRHEIQHNAGVRHDDFLKLHHEVIQEGFLKVKELTANEKIDVKQLRYQRVLQRIKEKESKVKRLHNSLKKLHKQKKYYEKGVE